MSTTRPLVIVESPYAPTEQRTIDDHVKYLRACLRDSWNQGELPFASHGFFPLFLRESNPVEREVGIEAGYSFWPLAERLVFYCDLGVSKGMDAALNRALRLGYKDKLRIRYIGGGSADQLNLPH